MLFNFCTKFYNPKNKKKKMNTLNKTFLYLFLLLLFPNSLSAYDYSPPLHQHISKEAVNIWKLTPSEIKNFSANPIDVDIDLAGTFYRTLDDIISGSGDEDTALGTRLVINTDHFFQPDFPKNGNFNDGLNTLSRFR